MVSVCNEKKQGEPTTMLLGDHRCTADCLRIKYADYWLVVHADSRVPLGRLAIGGGVVPLATEDE